MAYGDPTGIGAAEGTPTYKMATRDLGRATVAGFTPHVQETTHEVTGQGTFIKQVATASTALPLAASATRCRKIIVQALPTNTGVIVIGDSNVVAAIGTLTTATSRGIRLNNAGIDSVTLEHWDLNTIYIVSLTVGDGVSGWYFT